MKTFVLLSMSFFITFQPVNAMTKSMQSAKNFVQNNWQCLSKGTGPNCTPEKQARLRKIRNGLAAIGITIGTAGTVAAIAYSKYRTLSLKEVENALEKLFGAGKVTVISGNEVTKPSLKIVSNSDYDWSAENVKKLVNIIKRAPQNYNYIIEIGGNKIEFWHEVEGWRFTSNNNSTRLWILDAFDAPMFEDSASDPIDEWWNEA